MFVCMKPHNDNCKFKITKETIVIYKKTVRKVNIVKDEEIKNNFSLLRTLSRVVNAVDIQSVDCRGKFILKIHANHYLYFCRYFVPGCFPQGYMCK